MYFSTVLGTHPQNYRTIHRSFSVETPKQSKIYKQKHRHLLEMSGALMLTMNMPHYLWGKVVLTATYLINLLPTWILNFRTLVTVLTHCNLDYKFFNCLPIKKFGCIVSVHLSPPNRRIWILGQSSVYLRDILILAKCFCLHTKKNFASNDVTFLESQFYFTKTPLQWENLGVKENFFLDISTSLSIIPSIPNPHNYISSFEINSTIFEL